MSLGAFTVTHEFTVVHHLTVDCLLGADFFKRYKGIVDCGNSALLTKRNHQYTIPITQGTYKLQDVPPTSIISDAASVTVDDLTICSPSNLSRSNTVQFITGKLIVPCDETSALVDPSTQSLMHIGVARSMSPLANGMDIPLQVMNISPTPVTIYKGTKLAKAISE